MQTLKKVLEQNHSNKTKKELVELLTGIKEIVGSDYEKVTGIQVNELSKTKNDDLLAIVEDFKDGYKPKWEKGMAAAGSAAIKMVMDKMSKEETFSAASASDADFAAELGSIDFANIIGGPLNACVTAQSNASLATVSFIQEVGFTQATPTDPKVLRMVDFTHEKQIVNPDYGKDPADVPAGTDVTSLYLPDTQKVALTVPFISLLNVPSFRIETCKINFNVKLNSVYTRDVSDEFELDASLGIDYKWIKLDVSVGYKRNTSTGVRVEKEYSMGVEVVGTNDEVPGGLERVLGILAG